MANDAHLMKLTMEIVSAYGSNDFVRVDDLGHLVSTVHNGLSELTEPVPAAAIQPWQTVRASIRRDHLVCLICGSKLKTLKRHLKAVHGLTPQQYRKDLGLPSNYPMVTAEFARERQQFAKSIGLGLKRRGS